MVNEDDEYTSNDDRTDITLTEELQHLLKYNNNVSTKYLLCYLGKHLTMIEPTEQYVLK